MLSEKKIPNRLINEKSPYLLQHAYNPVDWFPWGEEAFEKAKREDKPVFLSIGYSTCHWCHVMEEESFEKEEVANILNHSFVAIKVDKEERPDIDAVYMTVCQMLTHSGGWPLTILMTPEQKPFYAGTYLPIHSRYNHIGLIELLEEAMHKWQKEQKELRKVGEDVYKHLTIAALEKNDNQDPGIQLIERAVAQFQSSYDSVHGGFGSAPKFPMPHNLLFLLRYGTLEGCKNALTMAEDTLIHMYLGGIFDHIGGGFSRYSTDDRWLVPHFEKMLYDNALLSYVYIEAFQLTGIQLFSQIAQKIIGYVLHELSDKKGGFYCGQDADSEGVEGKYYVFDKDEILNLLGHDTGTKFCEWYMINENGNFEGKNIPNLLENTSYHHEKKELESARQAVYDYRLSRNQLHKDDKVLTSWNAMMIAALAKASFVFGDENYLELAKKAQSFIDKYLTLQDNRLFVRWREGHAANAGQLDDYAFYAWSLIELYESSFDINYLAKAVAVADKMTALFWDEEKGGFYLSSSDSEQLIVRPKEIYDGAIPSGNSVAALVLVRLSHITASDQWRRYSDKQLSYLAGAAARNPMAHSFSLIAMLNVLYPTVEIICVTKQQNNKRINQFIKKYGSTNLNVLVKTQDNEDVLCKIAPFTKDYPIPNKGIAYYICRDGACNAPIFEEH